LVRTYAQPAYSPLLTMRPRRRRQLRDVALCDDFHCADRCSALPHSDLV